MHFYGDYPAGAANDPDAPFNDNTKICKHCGETLLWDGETWLHWETGEEECNNTKL